MAGSFGRSRYQHRRSSGRHLGRAVAGVAVLVVLLVAAGAVRVASESIPPLRVARILPTSVRFPGATPVLAWPAHGEAAVQVEGLGTTNAVGGDTPLPIASVAKVMSAYQILADHPLALGQTGFTVTVTAADVADYHARAAQAQSTVAVDVGEVLNQLQLLEALLVPSGNNIAAILANYDAGSQTAFVAKMNATARSLAMTGTTYTDASGFAATTVSTASDQLRLARAAMSNPVFAQIVALPSVTLPVAGAVANFNRSVGQNGFIGIKTGSDSHAGGCFVFANRQIIDGRSVTVLGAVLGQDPGQVTTSALVAASLSAAENLVRSVTAGISTRTVVPGGTTVAEITDAQGHRVTATTTRALTEQGWGGMTLSLGVSPSPVGRRLAAHQLVATVTLRGASQAVSTPVTATATMPPVTLRWKLRHLF